MQRDSQLQIEMGFIAMASPPYCTDSGPLTLEPAADHPRTTPTASGSVMLVLADMLQWCQHMR